MRKENENGKTVIYKVKSIDSVSFMTNSLSGLADKLPEGLYNGQYKVSNSSLEYVNVQDALLLFKCVDAKKIIEKNSVKIGKKALQIHAGFLMETLTNFVWCCNKVFIYMITWILNETSLPEKK